MPAFVQSPSSDSARLEALHRYRILDTPAEEAFNRVARLASTFFTTPMAFISFIEEDRQWFKACHGTRLVEAPRDTSFCTYTIASDDILVVPDARQDTRFCHIPFVADEPGVRFYAGAPLRTFDGHNIGTIFIIDLVPRLRLSPEQCSILEDLATMLMESLEAKRKAYLAEANERHLKHIIGSASDLIYTKDLEGRYTFLNRTPLGDKGPQIADIIDITDVELFPESAEQFTDFDRQVLDTQQAEMREETLYLNDQKVIHHSHKKPFFTPDGELAGILGVSRDVTEEVRIREELEQSLSLLQATFNATIDGLISVDLDYNILGFNQRFVNLWQLSADLVKKKDAALYIEFIMQQTKNPETFKAAAQRAQEKPEQIHQFTCSLKDGRWLNVVSTPQCREEQVIGSVISVRDVTRERQMRDELERSLSLLRTTFDAIDKGILNVGLDGTIHSFNQTYVDIWSVPDEVLDLRDDGEFIAHARGQYLNPATHLDTLGEVLRNPEATFKDVCVLKDGRFIKRGLTPQHLKGEVIGRVWTFEDVTSEFRIAQALRDSEEKFRELAENIDDMFWLASPTLDKTLYVSPAYEKIWGRSVETAYSDAKDYLDAIHYADKTRVLRAMERMLESNYDEIYRIIHPNGSLRWVRDRAFPVYDDNGAVKCYAGVTQDISERVSFEQRLEESEKRTRTVLESITDAFFSLDREWRFTYINEQANAHLRATDADLLNKNIWQTLPQIENSSFYTRCHIAASSGKAAMFEEYFPIIDAWFDIHVYPSAEGLSVYFHDISERRQQQENLRQAKEEAERANQAKSEFLSRMSHELRTPLNAILGFSQLLRMGDLNEEDNEAAKDIIKAGEHLLELINEVLDIARIESGHLALSLEPVCFAEALNETLEMLRPLAQAKGLSVHVDVPPKSYVKADWQRLKQVLLNLLSNAIKYNLEGGEIHIGFATEDDKSFITLRDTGIGIAPDMLPRVFDPFDRLGAETTSVEGTGIGLSLTKHLTELMGGAIRVESSLGEGSTFRLELQTASALTLVQLDAKSKEMFTLQKSDYKVVYIEDNLTNLKLVQRIFADMTNIELLSTVQGRIGIELAVQNLPDLILLDLHLPDMPGREVLRQLRSEELTKNIPILVISADAMPKCREEILDAGADAYLSKPLKLENFTDTVCSLLERP